MKRVKRRAIGKRRDIDTQQVRRNRKTSSYNDGNIEFKRCVD